MERWVCRLSTVSDCYPRQIPESSGARESHAAPSANITWEAESDQPTATAGADTARHPRQSRRSIVCKYFYTTLLLARLVWRLPFARRRLFIQPYGELLVLISRTLTTYKSPYGHP